MASYKSVAGVSAQAGQVGPARACPSHHKPRRPSPSFHDPYSVARSVSQSVGSSVSVNHPSNASFPQGPLKSDRVPVVPSAFSNSIEGSSQVPCIAVSFLDVPEITEWGSLVGPGCTRVSGSVLRMSLYSLPDDARRALLQVSPRRVTIIECCTRS